MQSSGRRVVGIALAGVLLIVSVGLAATEPPSEGADFADYELVPRLGDADPYAGPATPTSLAEVRISRHVDDQLTPAARERLIEHGFVIVPSEQRLFHAAYRELYGTGTPVFVTTDAAYHAWHLVFDKILRDVEQKRLLPALEDLVRGMRRNAAKQRDELAGTSISDEAERVHDLLAATASILGVRSGRLSERAKAEIALIEDHSAWEDSPVLGTKTDYSLFTPRGHYTRNEDLTRYFVAMSALGQYAFQLPGARMPDGDTIDDTEGLRLALLAARTIVGDQALEDLWARIYEPSAFLVGVADDYTPLELAAAVESTVPGGWADPESVTDDATLRAIGDALERERPVLVDVERPSVRLMGTRFVLDSWILDQLVGPNVGTREDPRVLGSPLDVAAAFGSELALSIQDAAGHTAKLNYPEQMSTMRAAVAERPDDAWGRTVYDAWLAAVEPMWLPHGEAFPDFMRSPAWERKSQQTGFGSYTELKHDTILYTKQAFGDTGGGPMPRPARHWVEPDPVPFQRLSAMAALTRAGLVDRGLLPDEQRRLLSDYIKLVDRLARIATDELAGEAISQRDNDWLRSIGFGLEQVWARSGDKRGSEADEDAALIADLMRGRDGSKDEVVEIGTGYVDDIYVIVPDDAGRFQVASGGVYSYYEFRWPTPDRLTDERWREMLAAGDVPDRPSWQEPLFPGAGPPADPPDPTPRPSRRALEQELGSAIDGATWKPYRKSPAGAAFDPFESGAVAAVIFDDLEKELHRSVDYVALFRFGHPYELAGYWDWRAYDAEPQAPLRTTPCGDGQPGRDVWLHGEYLCYVARGGNALLRWTDERTDTYGVMNAAAGRNDLERLYRHWETIVSGTQDAGQLLSSVAAIT